jgi:cytochrome bd-type quinol oxidase subunit 2
VATAEFGAFPSRNYEKSSTDLTYPQAILLYALITRPVGNRIWRFAHQVGGGGQSLELREMMRA